MTQYPLIADDTFVMIDRRILAADHHEMHNFWSARLSTGLFGSHSCKAGNRGPKQHGEILLYFGKEALKEMIGTGFIPCPTCKPENTQGFWEDSLETIAAKYSGKLASPHEFADKAKLGFDPRRLNWNVLLQTLGNGPGRIYLPQGLPKNEVAEFREEYLCLLDKHWQEYTGPAKIPQIGFYDHSAKSRFTEYK